MGNDSGRDGVSRARVALSTGSLYNWALERVFALAGAAGYDGVELLVDARMDSYDVPYLRDLSARSRMPIVSVHTPFAEHLEGWPEAPEGRVERAVQLAEALVAETVVVHSPLRWQVGHVDVGLGRWRARRLVVLPWHSPAGARYARWLLHDLPALQRATRVRVAVENMPAHLVCGRPLRLHRFTSPAELAQFPHLALDTTHWGTCGVDLLSVYSALRDRVAHVHLSDYDGREHRLPFKGRLALGALLSAMGGQGFAGVIAVEAEPRAVAEGDWSEAHLRQVLGCAAAGVRAALARPSHSHDVSTTPGPADSKMVA